MSKNHPHDNIYSILGKLEALKPTTQEKHDATVQQIRESVEAQGSILKGLREVGSVEQRLAKQFAESKVEEKAVSQAQQKFMGMVHAAQKGEKAASPAVAKVAKTMGNRDARDFAATKHKGLPQHVNEKYDAVKAVKQCAKDYMEMNGIRSVRDLEAEDIESIGGDCQMNYEDVCEILGCNLPDSLGPVKSWDTDAQGNKFDLEEGTCNECGMYESKCACPHTNEDMSRAAKGYEKYGKKGMQALAKAGRDGAGEKELDKIRDQHDHYNESEATHTGGEKVSTTKGTIHKSKATVDTEKELSRGDVPDLDKDDDAPVASAEKKGRGRPKMADKDRSQASMPWGGKPPKDTYKHQKCSFVHKIAESRIIDESGETLDHVLNRFKHEVKTFEQTGDLDDDLYDALFDYYLESGDIPYGVAKARTGDPYEWVAQNLESHLQGGGIVGGNQEEDPMLTREAGIPGNVPAEQIPGKEDLLRGKGRSYYEEEVTMEDELNELAKLAGLGEVSRGEYIKQQDTAAEKSGKDKFQAFGQEFDTDEISEDDIEEGPEIFKLKADAAKKAGEKEFKGPDGKTYPVKESTTFDGHGAEESNFSVNTSMSSDGNKNVTVTATGEHAAELLQMLRIAGLGNTDKAHELELEREPEVVVISEPEEMAEEGIEVDAPDTNPVNAPKPEYKTMRQSTLNPGEGDNGEKAMHPDRPTFMNGDNALAKPAMEDVFALESRLAAEYESIKKTSK